MRKLLIALIFVAAPVAAQDDEWEDWPLSGYWTRGPAGSVYTIELDEVQIDKRSKTITFWLHGDFSKDASVVYRNSLSRVVLTCDGYSRTTAYTTYMADGSVKDGWDNSLALRVAIRPGTIAAWAEDKLCAGEPFL